VDFCRQPGLPAGDFGETANGIQFRLQQIDAVKNLLIDARGGAIVVTQDTEAALTSASAGQSFDFEIVDDGNGQLSFTMTQVGNPGNTATVTGTVASDNFAQNFITFHNREGGNQMSYLDNVAITQVSIPPTHLVITGITRNPGTGAVTLTFASESGAIDAVDASTDLASWMKLTDSVLGQPGVTEYTDSTEAPGEPRLFYRVRPQP